MKFKVFRANFKFINCWFIKLNLDLKLILFVFRFANWPLIIVGLKLELVFNLVSFKFKFFM
jgi:hypothetical protein